MSPRLYHHVHAMVGISATDPWVLLVDGGTALWLIAYVVAIYQGHKERTYAIPLVAISANFTWEILAVSVWVAPIEAWHIGAAAWMGLDVFIVYQLFRYGRAAQVIPEIQRNFVPVALGAMSLALVLQLQYARYYQDQLGFEDAYIINTSMSILFPFMYFVRRNVSNSAWAIAWLKMAGTGVTSIAMVQLLPRFYPERGEFDFMYLLYGTTFGFDLIYLGLLAKGRRAARAPGGAPTPAAAPPSVA